MESIFNFRELFKSQLFYRIFLILVVTAITPLALSASAPMNLDKPVRQKWKVTVLTMFQDSTANRKRSSDNDRENQKPSQDDRDDRLKEAQRRAIKEVPRSLPKLKPELS